MRYRLLEIDAQALSNGDDEPETQTVTEVAPETRAADSPCAPRKWRERILRHWKSKLGAGIIGAVIVQNPIGFIIAAVIVHFYPPGKRVWIVILSLLAVLIVLIIIDGAQKQAGTGAAPVEQQ